MYNSESTNIRQYKKIVYVKSTLVVETYIIGYKNQGEAILFFVRADGEISFSGLVDCYRIDGIDKVSDILRDNNIDKLDFICWTHPDLDHSKGLKEIIDTYASNETYIWVPEGVDIKEIECSQEVSNLFDYLKKCTIDINSDLNVYSVSDRKDLMYYNSLCFQKEVDLFPLKLVSYAPNSKRIRKQNYLDKFIKNDRSIFFVVALGEMRILLTGDIEDATLEKLPGEFFEHVHILKIPHHGSETSTKIMEFWQDECDIACSTVYRNGNSNLPIKDVMDQYKENALLLYCTGKADKGEENEKYGIVKVVTDVLQHSYKTSTEGNSAIWNT